MLEIANAVEIVSSFETTLVLIQAKLDEMSNRQQCILTKLYELEVSTKKNTQLFNQSEAMFKACHVGFQQVRDACHVLREDLSEATGQLVTESWLD